MKDLIEKIALAKRENDTTVDGQKVKTIEEVAKLLLGICQNDADSIKDSIEAVMNTLITGAMLEGMTVEEMEQEIFLLHQKATDRDDRITYQIAMSVIGTLDCGISTYREALRLFSKRLALVAGHYGMTLEECLHIAIGKMENI